MKKLIIIFIIIIFTSPAWAYEVRPFRQYPKFEKQIQLQRQAQEAKKVRRVRERRQEEIIRNQRKMLRIQGDIQREQDCQRSWNSFKQSKTLD